MSNFVSISEDFLVIPEGDPITMASLPKSTQTTHETDTDAGGFDNNIKAPHVEQPDAPEEICQCSEEAIQRRSDSLQKSIETDPIPTFEKTDIGIKWRDSENKWIITDLAEYDNTKREPNKNLFASWSLVVLGKGEDESIHISSEYISQVLKSQLSYAPDISFDGKSMTIPWPYSTLFFHLPRLRQYVAENGSEDEQKEFEKLEIFYEKRVRAFHDEVRAGLSHSNIRFKNLWALFEPGTLLYREDEFGQPCLHMIGACSLRRAKVDDFDISAIFFRGTLPKPSTRFCVDAWCVTWDGAKRHFSREFSTFAIPEYSGTRAVTSFPVYPVKHWSDSDAGLIDDLLTRMEERGLLWRRYVSGTPCCRQYSGPAMELKAQIMTSKSKRSTRMHLSDRIIVDSEDMVVNSQGLYGVGMTEMGDTMNHFFSSMDTLGGMSESRVQSGAVNDDYTRFDSYPPDKEFEPIQARLCPGIVTALALLDQNGYAVSMQHITDVEWTNESFDALVLDPERKETLRGLVDQHAKNKERMQGDFVKGKGRGLIMVLHGPPGVGKTLTAEALAEHTKKPLLSVNVGELTLDNLGNRFREVFRKATRWDAVLLIDEADVLLEKRSYENLTRNGLVSVFLRMLEYYEGLLFLTTNRLKTIDPAFHSRIQIALDYPSLTPPIRRQIWTTFINRALEPNRRTELLAHLDDEMIFWPLNGREIRNVMLLAQSLAWNLERRQGALRFEHVERVARETMLFHDVFRAAEEEEVKRLGLSVGAGRGGTAWPKRLNGMGAMSR